MSARAPRASLGASAKTRERAFTLVELLVAMTVLIILMGLVMQITSQTGRIWRNSMSRIQTFQEARAGFEAMTRKLGQASLNTYYDYYNASNSPRYLLSATAQASFVPTTYDRVSDLHFISGKAAAMLVSASSIVTQTHSVFFQAPLGYSTTYQELDNALNACGYYLQFDAATSAVPSYISHAPGYKPRYRFRLMEMMQTTEALGIYYDPSLTPVPGPNDWFVKNAVANSRVIAENVIALVILPKLPDSADDPAAAGGIGIAGHGVDIAPNYNYNSRVPLGATSSDPTWPGANPPFPPDGFTAYAQNAGNPSTAVLQTRHHQLPPLLRVAMVVLDEVSAARIQGSATTPPPAINLAGTSLFTDATQFNADIQAVEDICNAKSGNLTSNTMVLNHRVFHADIIMRNAKWSNH